MGDVRSGYTNGYANGESNHRVNGHVASNGLGHPDGVASTPEPIAVVGMSMRLPGGIHTEEALWDLLVNKKTTRGPIPQSRYNCEGFYTESGKPGTIGVRHGHFLEDRDGIDVLDTSFFNVSKAEVDKLDPQQRMLLEVVWECVENAGQRSWRGSNTGVFVGAWGYDWIDILAKDPQQVGGVVNTLGSHDYAIANRVSYEYDLQGPSMTIKTACSSSLICVHQAVQALRNEECDAAIVAGTNLIMTPTTTIEQTESGVLSPTGECRTFDATANGYARGEAINALLLKKLSKAKDDKDVIRAVIRSTAVNCDGRSAGLTTPNPKAHVRLIKRAYEAGRLKDPSETPFVEVHGTGTTTGDPLELEAIAEVFGDRRDTYIGGVKANVGHSESASGITSVIKAVLALEKRTIPPQANFSTPNPKIPFAEARLVVPLEPTPWPEGRPERVSVNSFGITGANAHAVIESASSYDDVTEGLANNRGRESKTSELLLISATNGRSLKERCSQIQDYIGQHPQQISDLAYTLSCRRDHLSHRAYCITNGQDSVEFVTADRSKQIPKLTFVFTGQGAQWPSMGKELIERFPSFREDIIRLGNALTKLQYPPSWSLLDELLQEDVKSRVSKAEFSQPLCTAIQIALVNLLRSLDIVPSAVVGHSSGEIGAAYAAGGITAAEAISIAYYRGLVTTISTRRGAMGAIGLNQAEARLYLENGVVIACENSPQSVTLSGDEEVLDRIIERIKLDDAEVFTRRLKTDGKAYHSHHMAEIGTVYEEYLGPVVKERSPAIRFFSTVTGKLAEDTTLGPQYWRRNLESPVRFSPAVKSIIENGTSDQLFLEVGPHSALAGPLRQIFKASPSKARLIYCSSLVRGKDARECILDMCGQLYLQAVPLTFQILTTGSNLLTDLPTYPWNHDTSYWSENRAVKDWRLRKFPRHELLGSRVLEGNDVEPVWRNMLRLKDTIWLAGHKVYGDVVFPFAGYIAMAGEGVRQLTGIEGFIIRNLNVKTAMVVQDNPVEVMTSLRRSKNSHESENGWYEFAIVSHNGSTWAEHCDGDIRPGAEPPTYSQIPPSEALPRKIHSPYDLFQSVGLHYNGSFRGLEDVSAMPGQKMAVGTLKAQTITDSAYALHPATMDQCLQLLGMGSSEGLSRHLQRIPLPTFVEKISIQPHKSPDRLRAKAVATHISAQGDIEGEMIAMEGSTPVLVVEGCRLSAFEEKLVTVLDDPIAAARASWRPHIDFVPLETLMLSHEKDANDVRIIEEYGLLCSAEILERIKDTQDSHWHFTKFRKWMDGVVTGGRLGQNKIVSNSKELLELSSQHRLELIHLLQEKLKASPFVHVAELTTRLLDNCVGIFDGTTEVLEVYLKDDTLTKLYALTGARIDASEFFVSAGHSNPTLRVLEIGAGTGGTTLIALKALTSINNEPMYSSYTFTDISSGFFAAARDRFSEFPGLEFKTLDISRDPGGQGFELGTYDLIVASNVIHATEFINVTLKNVHKLLSPRGRFFLQEVIPSSVKMKNLIMGPLPGWWLGEADGRVNEPIISVERWSSELRAAGFCGIECTVLDDPKHEAAFGANMIAKPIVSAQEYKSVTILIRPDQAETDIVKLMRQVFEGQEYFVDICILGGLIPPSQDIMSLVEIDKPFFEQLTAEGLSAFQQVVAGLTSARMLWVMGSAQIEPSDALFGITLGLIRCIRAEMSVPLATLEIDKFDPSLSETILKVFEKFLDTSHAATNTDHEYVIDDNFVKVGRYHWTNVPKELEASQDTDDLPLKLEVEVTRVSKLLKWVPQPIIKIRPEEVVVRPIYVGMNPQDFSTLEEGRVRDYYGEIVEVGSNAGLLNVGDRVIALGSREVHTSLKFLATNVIKIPDGLDPENAASMTLGYATALHCLRDLARVQKDQTVLIANADSDVGLAAIRVCYMIGAQPYCSVHSEERARFLVNEAGISDARSVTTHSSLSLHDLASKSGKAGFDVVVNVLSESLRESCKYVAPRGKIISLGGPVLENLDMSLFATSRTFLSVDMGEMDDLYPELLKEIVSLYQQKLIEPIRPTRLVEIEELEGALRSSSKPDLTGKLLLKLPIDRGSLPIQATQPVLKFRSDVSYLIAGGLGGLGRAISNYMAEHGARHFIYLSRSAGSTSKYESFFRELEAQGCTFQALTCDITSLDSVRDAIQQVKFPIAGVLQMAMVIQDRPFLSMSHDDWTTAIKPKVDGTWNLHSALLDAKTELDFFVMFGSNSGAFGMPGQGNYAAGNSFQDAFVQYRHSLGLPASVLDIGVVSEVGYVSQNKDMLDYFRTAGFPILTEGQVSEALHLSILQQYPPSEEKEEVAARATNPGFTSRSQLTLGVRATKPMTDATNRVLFKRDRKADIYRNIQAASMNSPTTGSSRLSSGDKIAGLTASLREAADPVSVLSTPETLKLLRREIGVFIYESMLQSVEEEDMEFERSLMSLGVDSLVTVEVRSWLKRKLEVEVSTLEMLNGGTIENLGELVLERMKMRFTEKSKG
ncbi:uncharacterized protein Z518_08952 [Rhinocladiella mackenziei CBS 650.93]|uniref:Polyketide synthase n=1 Tax=Rhinocladiella mackenziei CBS 650.93 TaxID=1442369 RepID=A0A0D2FGT1_9EURO|nr:uncharacterized protein Z518_08952 [Rhinocladiella mackenziei CBS 650.93]KIX01227.1 hypothetical protein Z518_08952 [Rhinocladiella mackenziei CBS 650.93]